MSQPNEPGADAVPASPDTRSTGNRHVGDPRFQERQFVDPGGFEPPWYAELDPYFVNAKRYADVTIEEVEAEDYVQGVSVAGATPRASEMSWGLGNQNSLTLGPDPNPLEILKAQQRTNSEDPTDNHLNHYRDAGWVDEP